MQAMRAIKFSVVIPTHNPRTDFLERTLAALENQDLPRDMWELVIIDNKSGVPVQGRFNLAWHPCSRVLVEDKLGLTAARVCAIANTSGEVLVFVDDDNLLAGDYLSTLAGLASRHSGIGVFGSGTTVPEFEISPPDDLMPYTNRLALRSSTEARWSNLRDYECCPWGAGIAIRREVALEFQRMVTTDPRIELLGRNGASLSSAEDLGICNASILLGFGNGVFPELKLTHLIDKRRLTHAYIYALVEAQAASLVLFEAISGRPLSIQELHRCDFMASLRKGKLVECILRLNQARKLWLAGPAKRAVASAERRGISKALLQMNQLGIGTP